MFLLFLNFTSALTSTNDMSIVLTIGSESACVTARDEMRFGDLRYNDFIISFFIRMRKIIFSVGVGKEIGVE